MDITVITLSPEEGGILFKDPVPLQAPQGCTVEEALVLLGKTPESARQLIAQKYVAIYGVTACAGQVLHEGDRLELLDDLRFDPMESRRRRVSHKRGPARGS